MHSRPTIYKGIRMRSRLEASFAAYLDTTFIKENPDKETHWKYEPQCFADHTGQYLPDFVVTAFLKDGRRAPDHYFEVKPPSADLDEAMRKMHLVRSADPSAYLFVTTPIGFYPDFEWSRWPRCTNPYPCKLCIGNFVPSKFNPHIPQYYLDRIGRGTIS